MELDALKIIEMGVLGNKLFHLGAGGEQARCRGARCFRFASFQLRTENFAAIPPASAASRVHYAVRPPRRPFPCAVALSTRNLSHRQHPFLPCWGLPRRFTCFMLSLKLPPIARFVSPAAFSPEQRAPVLLPSCAFLIQITSRCAAYSSTGGLYFCCPLSGEGIQLG